MKGIRLNFRFQTTLPKFASKMADSALAPLLLILDLDETIIHATTETFKHPPHLALEQFHVYIRPHLQDFLRECDSRFKLAVWSSASECYVQALVKLVFPSEIALEFVWSNLRCTPRPMHQLDEFGYGASRSQVHYEYTKPLKKIKNKGYDLARVLIVDDTPAKVNNAYGNAIYIGEFIGDPEDDELLHLSRYLQRFEAMEDVRRTEKRHWRERMQVG